MKQKIKQSEKYSERYHKILISICLAAAIIAVYWPVYKYDFIKYDDDMYVYNNTNIRQGINWSSVCWAFSTGHTGNYHPVTWFSHMADYQLFKNYPGGHHLVSVLFHIANTIILFYLLFRMTSALWPSAFVAAVFALHPLHVESVAWIAERKDVLSTFFWFLTMLAYVEYVKNLKYKWYVMSLILFVLGLMSKPMLVTVPFVLLLLDYWPLERKWSWRLVIEKIPFFILSITCSMITFLIPRYQGTLEAGKIFSLRIKIYNALVSYLDYILKMIWPSRLALLYPPASSSISIAMVCVGGIAIVLLTIIFVYFARRYRFLTVGWLWFLGTLVPVIGIIQVGQLQAMADRYTYVSLTGLFIIIAWGIKEFVPKRRYKLLILPAAVMLIALGITAGRQLRYWKNSITLFEHTLAVTKNNYVILNNYVICLNEVGRFDEVIEKTSELLKIKPDSVDALNNRGIALAQTGRAQEAVKCFNLALEYKPDDASSYFNLAVTLQNQDKPAEAADGYRRALKLQPNYIGASVNLAAALIDLGKTEEAIEVYRNALQFEPYNENLRQLLGEAMKK